MKILNKERGKMEEATVSKCPRCKGFGKYGNESYCRICDGHGKVWRTKTGWILRLFGRIKEDEILY